jgi:hypothetical protein
MLLGFAIILIILWSLAIFGSPAIGGSIDLLLVIAALLLVIELRRGYYLRDSASDPDGGADVHGRGPAVVPEQAQVHHPVSGRPQESVTARAGAVASGDDVTVVVRSGGETAPVSDKPCQT